MNQRVLSVVAAALFGAGAWSWTRSQHEEHVIDAVLHHLGNDPTPDWTEAPRDPEGTRLDLRFRSAANASEWLLFIDQRSVGETWRIELNGHEIARLQRVDGLVTRYYPIPPKALRNGDNELAIVPDVPADDIVVGKVRLYECSLRELYDLQPVEVRVLDADTKRPLPARVTFADEQGQLVPLYYGEAATTAMRDGVIYTSTGGARLELPPGEYRSFATRGAEWGLSEVRLVVAPGKPARVAHSIRREVDTTGFIACDTHLHTLTFSGHGDASVEERQVTLAGEGVELAVATDHNHNTDYRPAQKELGLNAYFTAVTGNEVTTEVGHFNAFPLDPKAAVPPHDAKDYVQIVEGIRAKGAMVVILNHPRWPDRERGPFGVHHLDHFTGARAPELKLPVDATELVNATCDEPEPMLLFRDWFALMNRGERIFAVGSSDSHTVGDPAGQGRTYVVSATDDPAKIDVEACCDAIKNGRTSISMGIFATVTVDDGRTMGDTLERTRDDAPLSVALRVQAPTWVRPRKATVFMNGLAVAEQDVPVTSGAPTDAQLLFSLPLKHAHDAWLVCVVTGDDVAGEFWTLLNPYTLAATNPVFVDRDGRGYQSPRESAAKLLDTVRDSQSLRDALARADDTVAVHLLDLKLESELAKGRDRAQVLDELRELARDRAPAGASVGEFLATR